jgi:hypothetical protein
MPDYSSIQKEETLKAQIFSDYFSKSKYAYEPNIDNIDFIVTDAKLQKDSIFKRHYLWAEAKKGIQDIPIMITQLILTIKKTYDKGEQLPPPYLGCFDSKKIAFIPFHDILPIFNENDFNWNVTPSNHDTEDFIKARTKVQKLIAKNLVVFEFETDKNELTSFIITNLVPGSITAKNQITKNNFVHIYNRWVKEVKPYINIPKDEWTDLRNAGILDCDFYRADIMSSEGNTITEKLKIILEKDNYKLQENIKGRLFSTTINFTDGGTAYHQFWNKYKRPPAHEYQQYIIDRRDLLVPQNIREIKGSFFTPAIWVEKSQEYLEAVFGKDWQDEYVIWDCAAGTGNLLAGLVNKYNIWASTLDQPDVDTIHALIDEGFNLLPDHVFQFDFLNDKFDKLPEGLRLIIDDPEKRKKLIIYINPPYAEAGNQKMIMGGGDPKTGVSINTKVKDKYHLSIGTATNDLSTQFMARIFYEIQNSNLAVFSKLKFVCAQNFIKFRDFFKASYKSGFVVPASTFDNVQGNFPIAFTIWELNYLPFPSCISVDAINTLEKKKYYVDNNKTINHWIRSIENTEKDCIGYLICESPDFQKVHQPYITLLSEKRISRQFYCNKKSLIMACVYLSVRICIEPNWLNDRDQFLFPNDGWKNDVDFINDCIAYTLFHGQNRIIATDGVNHWIPFTEQEVNAKEKFKSNFMSTFIKDKNFSFEAQQVINSGKELWRYYHLKINDNRTASVDASFYDIREYFQGRSEKSTMKQKSDDNTYNVLIKDLRQKLSVLAKKIKPKVYEYGFLLE